MANLTDNTEIDALYAKVELGIRQIDRQRNSLANIMSALQEVKFKVSGERYDDKVPKTYTLPKDHLIPANSITAEKQKEVYDACATEATQQGITV